MNFNFYFLCRRDRGFGWLHNLKNNWDAFTEGYINNSCTIATNTNEAFAINTKNDKNKYRLNHFKAGNYNLDTYNTRTGVLINHYSATDNETPWVDPITPPERSFRTTLFIFEMLK